MTLWIDRVINMFKWPCALFLISALPFLLQTLPDIISKTLSKEFVPFWGGLFGYIFFWKMIFRHSGSFLPTLAHESTHAVFALCTGHRVVDFQVRWSSGGHVSYVGGKGNWLITISPYFFPLVLLLTIPTVLTWMEESAVRSAVLGAIFSFELVSAWRQIHPKQLDLIKVGWFFCFLFLPPALLTVYGSVLYFLISDVSTVLTWYQDGARSVFLVWSEVIDGHNSY